MKPLEKFANAETLKKYPEILVEKHTAEELEATDLKWNYLIINIVEVFLNRWNNAKTRPFAEEIAADLS